MPLLPFDTWAMLAIAIYITILGFSINKRTFNQLINISGLSFRVGFAIAALSFFWSLKVGIYKGLEVHFLLTTALTLTMGWRMSMLICAIILALLCTLGVESWQDIGYIGLLKGVFPIVFAYFVYAVSYHRLPRHFAIYVFVCSFLAGALALVLHLCLNSLLLGWMGVHEWSNIINDYLVVAALMWFPEALLNGMAMTLLVVYRPDWVYTFYDEQYLDGN